MATDGSFRERRERQLGATYAVDDSDPRPPYHYHSGSMLYFVCRFDSAAARSVLPAGLEPAGEAIGIPPGDPLGVFGIFQSADGWPFAPFAAGFSGIWVKGFDSGDGAPACYLHSPYFSGRQGAAFRAAYNTNIRPGRIAFREADRRVEATVHDEGDRPVFRMSATRSGEPGPYVNGINHYLGRLPGGIGFNTTTYSCRFQDTADGAVELLAGALPELRRLPPKRIEWPAYVHDLSHTYGPPILATPGGSVAADEAARVGLLQVFSQLGRAAAVVGEAGNVVGLNTDATALKGDGFTVLGGRLVATSRETAQPLERAVAAAADGKILPEPTILPRQAAASPLIAQAVPIDPAIAWGKAALVLFVDPAQPARGDISRTLQLMGLTPAEARIAALVGTGVAPREAAERLDITENTLRTTTRIVYDKLGIGRLPELTRIVARIEYLGKARPVSPE